jgi:chromate transporter
LTQVGWFFSKAALVTFGGAYAVLPYVFQGGVEHYRWLSTAQMMDGLALGETTPGPLIMVVAFIGFVAAWSQAALGSDSLLLTGIAGACVATFFTFLPSFVFILVGAPLVEATRAQPRLTAPLTAITAAVVGVIAHFGLFLAKQVMWPVTLDIPAVAIGATAFVAIWRFKVSVVTVVIGGALMGWVLTLW